MFCTISIMEFQLITNQLFLPDECTYFDRLLINIVVISSFSHPQLGNSHKTASKSLV